MKTRALPLVLLAAAAGPVWGEEEIVPEFSVEVAEVSVAASAVRSVAAASGADGFVGKLSAQEKSVAGLDRLSAEQRGALDGQIAKEVNLARQGDVPAFKGTFISRRTEEERTAAGLGNLSTSEKYQLDRLALRALATRPAQPPIAIARAATNADVVSTPFKWETHGFVQLEYGWGSGDREYKAATVAVTQVNPRTGTAFTFAYTVAEGDNWWSRGCSAEWRRRVW